MGIMLSGSSGLKSMSLVVTILVILLIVLCFIGLFFLVTHFFRKCINLGLEDNLVKKEILSEYGEFFEKAPNSTDKDIKIVRKQDKKDTPLAYMKDKIAKKRKVTQKIMLAVIILLYVILGTGFVFGLYSRISTGVAGYFGAKVLVIETGSMEKAHPNNTYISENGLEDQILQYSLINIDDIENEDDMKLFKIYAFYDNDGNIIVHRLINIKTTEDGTKLYTFRGDANSGSGSFETNIKYEKVLGEYTGYSSFFLGASVLFLQSNIGMISFTLGIGMVVIFDIYQRKVDVTINKRKDEILETL
ncbi:MAG: hypothetical protein ACI311_00790 [Bacilli bacterium]